MTDTTTSGRNPTGQSTREEQAARLVAAAIRAEFHGDASRATRLATALKDRQRSEQERPR